MPHQCLKCGSIIPNGSPEILKGCDQCGGKKFFYITQPISNVEREDILNKVEKERTAILKKSNKDLDNYLDEFIKNLDKSKKKESLTDEEISTMFKKAYVKVKETESKKSTEKDPIEKKYMESPKVQVVRDIKDIDSKKYSKTVKDIQDKKDKSKKDGASGMHHSSESTDSKKKGDSPEVIKVVESGVYEIDVQALLEGKPIIVQKDGTYLIHLPSLLNKSKKKNKRS